jgi:hypothetical protein
MTLSYEVSEDLVVSIWGNTEKSGDPMITQPDNPISGEWSSVEECEEWAQKFIADYNVPEFIKNPFIDEPVVEVVEEEPAAIEAPAEEEEINA